MNKKIIFVIGTGRSGTHLIGRSISSNPEIEGRIEEPSTFQLISKIASTQDYFPEFFTNLRKRLLVLRLNRVLSNAKTHVLEKSHPSLWLVDFLVENFEQVYFVAVKRNLEPTVNSMLNFRWVLKWYKQLPQSTINRFLGINAENVEFFDSLSLEEKCALRWKSHYEEIDRISEKYPERILVIDYESFMKDQEKNLGKISQFLGIENKYDIEPINYKALDKWKSGLSADQLKRIRRIVGQ